MKNLKLTLEKAQEAYAAGNADRKKLLIDLYGKEHFLTNVKDRVTDYESACLEIGIKPLTEEDFGILPKEDRKRYFNRHILTIAIRALVGDWKPDWSNSNEYKYYNYFYVDNGTFSSGVSLYFTYAYVGSDFVFPSKDLAEHVRTTFKQNYIDYLF